MKDGAELFRPRDEDTVEVLPRCVVERCIGERIGDAFGTFGFVVLVGDEGAVVLPVGDERGGQSAMRAPRKWRGSLLT
jgi:hypothetical protein